MQDIATKNCENRKKLLVGHTLGTKSIPKKKHELVIFDVISIFFIVNHVLDFYE